MTDDVDTVQTSKELERLVAAAEKRCTRRYGCKHCQAVQGLGGLEERAPALAREVLALRKQNALALKALETIAVPAPELTVSRRTLAQRALAVERVRLLEALND